MCSKISALGVKKYLISFLLIIGLSVEKVLAQTTSLDGVDFESRNVFLDRIYHASIGVIFFSLYIFFSSVFLYFIRDDEAVREKATIAIIISTVIFVIGAGGWIYSR